MGKVGKTHQLPPSPGKAIHTEASIAKLPPSRATAKAPQCNVSGPGWEERGTGSRGGLIAQLNGTPPVVHAVGGMQDTVEEPG